MARRRLIAGNWKMNGLNAGLAEMDALLEMHPEPGPEIVVCPPFTLIAQMAWKLRGKPIGIGGQDCHAEPSGAHTGDVSAGMLADAGASYVILGHSERRENHGERDALIRAKGRTALAAGLRCIICVGETEDQRLVRNTLDIIGAQMAMSIPDNCTGESLVVAYEPVWAIGTGKTPTLDDIGEVHDFMRMRLENRFGPGVGRSVRLLYGGSVKPGNAAEILRVSNVDGALVGGASLKATDFGGIIAATPAAVETGSPGADALKRRQGD